MKLHTANAYIRPALLVIFIGIVAYYAYVQGSTFARGPILTIEVPTSGTMVSESLLMVGGQVRHVSEVELNGQPIVIDESGHFTETLLMMRGHNIITVSAKDKFGRVVIKTIEIVYRGRESDELGLNH